MLLKIPSSPLVKYLWIFFSFIIGLIAFTALSGWGDFDRDEVFQTYCVLNWQNISVAPLSHFLGNKWLNLTGISILNLRLLTTLITIISISISCVYSFLRTRNVWLTGFLFATMAWIWRSEAFMLYNWDSGSMLWNTISLICIVEYFRKTAPLKSALCGIAFALTTLSRVPSGIILPLFILLLIVAELKHAHSLKSLLINSSTCVLCFILTALLILYAIDINIADYLSNFHNNSISGHSLTNPSHYYWRLIFLFPYYLLENFISIICLLLPLIFRKRLALLLQSNSKESPRSFISISLFFVAAIAATAWLSKNYTGAEAQCLYGAGCALAIGLLLAIPVRNYSDPLKPKISAPTFQLWGCVIILIAVSFGSDAFFERIPASYTLPVIIALLWNINNKNLRLYITLVLAIALSCFLTLNLIHWNKMLNQCTYTYSSSLTPFQGLKASRNLEAEHSDIAPAINYANSNNLSYIIIGDRHTMSMLFGNDAGPEMNQFHFRSDKPYSWQPQFLNYLNHTDAMVYAIPNYQSDIDLQKTVDLMRSYGYTHSTTIGNSVILTKNAPNVNHPEH